MNNNYHENLKTKPNILRYIKSRGINDKSIEKFQIGYCNNGYFSNKITFPIVHKGEIKYYTSRVYPENGKIKHLHQKGKILYAINHDILYVSDYVFIVEGPFDCITLDQNKIASVGLLGANRITQNIIRDLQSKRVYIAFDKEPNKSGDKAAFRLAKKLMLYGIPSIIVNLPDIGEKIDINSYFQNHTKKDFMKLVKEAKLFNIKQEYKKTVITKCSISIIDTAYKYLEVIKTGGRYKANCPFHKENDPSLVLYSETESFYCFGCGMWGNALTLINKMEKL